MWIIRQILRPMFHEYSHLLSILIRVFLFDMVQHGMRIFEKILFSYSNNEEMIRDHRWISKHKPIAEASHRVVEGVVVRRGVVNRCWLLIDSTINTPRG